jgi:hypothetical protein
MSRNVLAAALLLLAPLAACERDQSRDMFGWCDSTGCFACTDNAQTDCWTLSHPACTARSQCSGDAVCTNIGCVSSCHYDGDCRRGEICTDDGYCSPNNVIVTVVDGTGTPKPGAVCGLAHNFCQTNAQCGAGKLCSDGACQVACAGSESCPVGQACALGVCTTTAPAVAECLWDFECGAGFRCINATCHPPCTTTAQCRSNEQCDSGVCRADVRALP